MTSGAVQVLIPPIEFVREIAPENLVFELWTAPDHSLIKGPAVLDSDGKRIGQLVVRFKVTDRLVGSLPSLETQR